MLEYIASSVIIMEMTQGLTQRKYEWGSHEGCLRLSQGVSMTALTVCIWLVCIVTDVAGRQDEECAHRIVH